MWRDELFELRRESMLIQAQLDGAKDARAIKKPVGFFTPYALYRDVKPNTRRILRSFRFSIDRLPVNDVLILIGSGLTLIANAL